MYKKYSVCNSDELENLINSTPDGKVCNLEKKEYYLTRRVQIKNKNNITVDGTGAKIITKFVNSADYTKSADAFLIEDCKNVTLQNFVFDTDVPVNMTLYVEDFNEKERTITFKADDSFEATGKEELIAFGSIDEEGSYDYKLHRYCAHPNNANMAQLMQDEILLLAVYSGVEYDYLGNGRYKIVFNNQDYSKVFKGQKVCARHTMYGPCVITVRNSDDTCLKDITINSAPGMGIIVLARSNNMVIDGLKMVLPKGSKSLMAGNCDGIHLAGLTGKFVLKNSVFDGLGDDALNIHATAGTVTDILSDNKIKCNYCKKSNDGILPKRWCRKGDEIRIFDPETLQVTAKLKTVSFEGEYLEYELIEGSFKIGDKMQNAAVTPECIVESCNVRNTKARGLLFQTENIEINNCEFYGTPDAGVMFAPAFKQWYEVGPAHNVKICNNKFEKCGFSGGITPAILVNTSHSRINDGVKHLHSNFVIENNTFVNCPEALIEMYATDNIVIKNNNFVGRQGRDDNINLVNCEDVFIDN